MATMPSFIAPLLVAWLLPAWQHVFALIAVVALVAGILFAVFVSDRAADDDTSDDACAKPKGD